MRTGGRGGAKQFSIVVQLNDTLRVRAFAKKSLPSTAAPGPGEIAVGVDRTSGGAAERFVEEVRRQHRPGGVLNMARVKRSDARRFHLGNAVWHCCMASLDDTVLVFGIVAILRAATIRGLEPAGRDGNAAVGTTKRILTRNIIEQTIRLASLRVRATTGANALAVLYLVHLPYYFAGVREAGVAFIANRLDDCTVTTIRADGIHRVVPLPGMGEDSLDLQNPNYPWRQFGDGIRHGTNDRRGGRVCGNRCTPPLSRSPRRPHASARISRRGGGPCRTTTRRYVRWRDCARSPSGLRSTSQRTSGTLANGTAGRRGFADRNGCAVGAACPARSGSRGGSQKLAIVRRRGIKGHRHPHCAVNGAGRRGP